MYPSKTKLYGLFGLVTASCTVLLILQSFQFESNLLLVKNEQPHEYLRHRVRSAVELAVEDLGQRPNKEIQNALHKLMANKSQPSLTRSKPRMLSDRFFASKPNT